jgi:predicted DsbA family dithiol-disulfide isomerase
VADSLTLPFGGRSHTYNSRNAQELGIWVAETGEFEPYLNAVYRAYFVEGVNIAESEELLRIIKTLGLNVDAAQKVLQARTCAEAVDREWDRAVSTGVRAVPTLRCEGRELVGFQAFEAHRQLISG